MFIQVLITKQRYKFESNSQLRDRTNLNESGCLLQSKDTNLKAIHNMDAEIDMTITGAYYKAKIQI